MLPDFADHYVTVDGLKIHYWDEGTGSPLLLIHGVGVTVDTWAYNMDALSAKYRVVALDIPGFGKSARTTRKDIYSLEYSGRFLYNFIRELGISSLDVVGNSMGGMLAIQFSLMYRDRVKKLILADAAGLGREMNLGVRLMATWPIGELLIHPTRQFATLFAKALLYHDELVTEEFIDKMLKLSVIPGTKEALINIVRTGVNLGGQFAPYPEAELRKLTMPTLVVWGKQDMAIPFKQAMFALRAIPDCRAVVMDKAGHPPQMDRPEDFNRIVLEFLDKGRLSIENSSGEKKLVFI